MSQQSLPAIYQENWIKAETDPELFIGTYISPDLKKPLKPTDEQLNYLKAVSSGDYTEGWFAGGNSCQPTELTKVLMADGEFKLLKDIRVGDEVFCPDDTGKAVPGKVVAWHDRGEKEVFKLSFSDGGYVYATKEHNFPSWKRVGKDKIDKLSIKRVDEMKISTRSASRDRLIRGFIEFPEVDLPIEPYFMGVLLGDGGITKEITVTTVDFEILDELKRQCELLDLRLVTTSDHITYRLSSQKEENSNRGRFKKNPITKELEVLGLFGGKSTSKFIPDLYKKTSIKQRMDLLAGLIDTDGSSACGNEGLQYEFFSSSKQLAKDVEWLCKSLGMHAKYSDRKVNGFFNARVYISSNEPIPCKIKRKQFKRKSYRPRNQRLRVLRLIESVGMHHTCEITVNSPDNFYISDDWVVTKNSGKTWTAKFLGTWFGSYKIRPLSNKPFSSYQEYLQTPYNILCTGPESKQAMELWQEIERSFKESPILKFNIDSITTGSRRNIHPSIVLTNGTKIEAVGLQDKGKHVEGQAYDLVLINEPPDVRHLIHAYERVLIPRTWRRDGIIGGFGTPKGKTDYYNLWRRGRKYLGSDYNKYYDSKIYSQISDSRSNPYANQDAILRGMEGKSDEYIKERIEGDFVDSALSCFKDSEIDLVIDTELKSPITRSSNHQYIHGIDFGRKGDFTGMITWDVSVRPHVQVSIYRNGGGVATWENIFEDILKIYNMYGGDCIVDSTGMAGDMQLTWLDDLGIPYYPFSFGGSPGKKVALINNLQDYISKRKFKMPYNDQLVSELRNYPANHEDKGIETDMTMALALVAWGARNYEPLPAPEAYSR